MQLIGAFMGGVVVGAMLVALPSCSSAPQLDPATAARQARRTAVAACNAYDAAVSAGVAQPDDRADFACASTRGICADDLQVEP